MLFVRAKLNFALNRVCFGAPPHSKNINDRKVVLNHIRMRTNEIEIGRRTRIGYQLINVYSVLVTPSIPDRLEIDCPSINAGTKGHHSIGYGLSSARVRTKSFDIFVNKTISCHLVLPPTSPSSSLILRIVCAETKQMTNRRQKTHQH